MTARTGPQAAALYRQFGMPVRRDQAHSSNPQEVGHGGRLDCSRRAAKVTAQASLVICRRPQGRHWRLGPLSPQRGHVALLGWRLDPPHADAGVHAPIDRILADTLTACGRVTFLWPLDETGSAKDDDIVYCTDPATGLSRLGAQLAGQHDRLGLMATRNADTAARMFDLAGFDWTRQGQLALLSIAEALPPVLDRTTILDLLSDGWLQRCAEFEGGPVRAVLRPGIDGDVAGLFCADSRVESRLLKALADSCRIAGASWSEAEDDQCFADRLLGRER